MKAAIVVLALGVLVAAAVGAHEGHKSPKPGTAAAPAKAAPAKAAPVAPLDVRQVQIIGELIDPQCWFTHDGQGADHRKCAIACAEGGQDLALLETRTGLIYPILAASHGQDPNKGLIEHVATPVKVSGTFYSRGQNRALLVQGVQRVR